MIEKFSKEELEQIKRELGLSETRLHKPNVCKESEFKLFSLGLTEIDGKETGVNPLMNDEYGKAIRLLADLVTCCYVPLCRRPYSHLLRLYHSKSVEQKNIKQYVDCCEDIINCLHELRKKYKQLWEYNTKQVTSKWNQQANDSNTRFFTIPRTIQDFYKESGKWTK